MRAFTRALQEISVASRMLVHQSVSGTDRQSQRLQGAQPRRLGRRPQGQDAQTPDGAFFPEDVIERYCRVDRALVAATAEMYVLGISSRKIEEVAGALDVSSISKWQVSRLDERLDVEAGDVSPPEIRRREVRLPVAPPT